MSQPNRAKLTKGYVERIKPGAKGAFHWDIEVKGFGLRVTPTGKMTFILQGRAGVGAWMVTVAAPFKFRGYNRALTANAGALSNA